MCFAGLELRNFREDQEDTRGNLKSALKEIPVNQWPEFVYKVFKFMVNGDKIGGVFSGSSQYMESTNVQKYRVLQLDFFSNLIAVITYLLNFKIYEDDEVFCYEAIQAGTEPSRPLSGNEWLLLDCCQRAIQGFEDIRTMIN